MLKTITIVFGCFPYFYFLHIYIHFHVPESKFRELLTHLSALDVTQNKKNNKLQHYIWIDWHLLVFEGKLYFSHLSGRLYINI